MRSRCSAREKLTRQVLWSDFVEREGWAGDGKLRCGALEGQRCGTDRKGVKRIRVHFPPTNPYLWSGGHLAADRFIRGMDGVLDHDGWRAKLRT